ncbi:MAG: hypothetical protein ACOYLK_18540 [Sphingomonas sp.]
MKRFGMVTPIGIDDSCEIIYGHARYRAAAEAGSKVRLITGTNLTI